VSCALRQQVANDLCCCLGGFALGSIDIRKKQPIVVLDEPGSFPNIK
jgi:hypothetical protein